MNALRLLGPVFALVLAAAPVAAQDVGVAAAVNQSAQSTKPNAAVRTIGLGDNVIYNERIDTNDVGLVQLLLADGTTFTVGPNSSLVIDSFVYDPAAGTAQVAATLTKGVLRFIGAATSKTPDGVAITTPVGVVGIRGGVTDINMSPPPGMPQHISMIFGNSVTLSSSGGQLLGRLFEAGFSLAVTGGSVDTVKTPPEWSSLIQQALSSNPGQNGGANDTPSDNEVADIAAVNSNTTPPVPPTPMPPLNRTDDLSDNVIVDPVVVEPPRAETLTGYSAGIVRVTHPTAPGPGADFGLISISSGFTTEFTKIAFDASGKVVSGELSLIVLGNCNANCFINVKIDSSGSIVTALDGNSNLVVQPINATIVDHTAVTLPAGTAYCQCDFLRWGFWSMNGTATDPNTGATANLNVTNGTWVAAKDITTSEQLATLANTTATFRGHAVGTYSDSATATAPTLTAGAMEMNWSFGHRTGTIAINNFGGRNLTGNLVGDPSMPGFIGLVTDGANADGIAKGSFANDGSSIARGVYGDFSASDGSWTGSGIFMGTR